MINCLNCGKCEMDKVKNAVCKTEDEKSHLVLERSLYDNEGDFRKALSECGVNCGKWMQRSKNNKVKPAPESKPAVASPFTVPKFKSSSMSFRRDAGWAVAGAECAFIAAILVLLALGAL